MKHSNIPTDLTNFVGREQECVEVRALLHESRLLTLTGPGGVGKTRLAKEVARQDGAESGDVVAFVELAEVADAEHLVVVVAAAVGAIVSGDGESVESLVDHLGNQRTLLVLDNCEHLVTACGRFASAILRLAPAVTLMTTSREPLGILGERTWPVPPLSLPRGDLGAAGDGDAVRLFVDRARSVAPDFSTTLERLRMVGELCRRLDGIPLAIELAAVRSRSFDVAQMLSEEVPLFEVLDRGNEGGPVRHHTLRKAIEWSYDLCTPEEQALWSRLAVFAGSFSLAAARSVCGGDGLAPEAIVPLIGTLVEKSVVTCDLIEGIHRYRLLESLRVFGFEHCPEPETWRRRHRDYYLGLAQESAQKLSSDEQLHTVRRLQGELANIRSAVDYSLSHSSERLLGLEMTGALWFYWNACGHLQDGCRWLRRALAQNPESSPARAKALWVLGWYEMVQGDNASARHHLEAARDMGRVIGDAAATATAMQFLGTVEEIDGNTEAALELLEEAQRHHREMADDNALSILCGAQLAMVHALAGRLDRAREICDAALAQAEAHDERWAASWAHWNRGLCEHLSGEAKLSNASLATAVTQKAFLQDWLGGAACVEIMVWNEAELGEMARAARLLGIGRMLCSAMGGRLPLFGSPVLNATRANFEATVRRALGDETFEHQFSVGADMAMGEAISYVLGASPTEPVVEHRAHNEGEELTAREQEIARLIYEGLTNKDIAEELTISRRTVEGHVNRILAKLHFRSRSQVAVWFSRRESMQTRS